MDKILKRVFNKNTLKVFFIIYALFSIITVLSFADYQLCKDLKNIQITDLNNNWNISINDNTYENVQLDTFRFKPVKKGDVITLERTLPDNRSYVQPAMTLHIRQTLVDMYINDEPVYHFGHNRNELGKTVGSGLHIINFNNDYCGQQLKIVLTATENNIFSSLDPIYLSEWSDSFRLIVSENRLPLFLGSFLVVFGIAVSLVVTFAVIFSKKYANILWLAVFSIFMGFWTLCYHNITIIFSIPLHSASLLEYMTLMMAPLPILGYMYTYVKQADNKRILLSYKILFILQIILSVLTIVLHTTNVVHSAGMLPFSQALFVIHALFFTYVLLRTERQTSKHKLLYVLGFVIILSCIVYDLAIYILNRYAGLQLYSIKGVSSFGIISFIGILILDLYRDITLKMMEEHERQLLIKRAYTDELTQINNRNFCSEYMEKIQANNIYSIIAFDLNDLKKTNDTLGHLQGDILIKSAADVISEAFSSTGIVGRMGGDEFIAILPINDSERINALISHFDELIAEKNTANPDLHLSISYGFATCDEIQPIEKVYQLADDRMYQHKTNYKKSRNSRN